jgi:PilZ domain
MPDEKRKHKRFKGKEGAFAAFLRPNELVNLGNVVDISMGGLCVRYLSTADAGIEVAGIKIFGSNGRFIHVDRVECKVVYDVEIPEVSWEQLSTRRCGVQFENLSVRHMTRLQDFIEHFGHEESYSI